MKVSKEELEQHYAKESQLLVEARQKAKQRLERGGKEVDSLRAELEALNTETEILREREEKVSRFVSTATVCDPCACVSCCAVMCVQDSHPQAAQDTGGIGGE